MKFHIGPYCYELIITGGEMYNADGCELDGLAVESQKLLILSHKLSPEDREQILYHEVVHAWGFHGVKPTGDEEDHCQQHAMIRKSFNEDFDRQGGKTALMGVSPIRMGNIGRPARKPTFAPPLSSMRAEAMAQPFAIECATCGALVLCGSTQHGLPVESSGHARMQRWFECESCGAVQVWWEWCDGEGNPTGAIVPVPKPMIYRGEAAAKWIARELVLP